ncbi:MAG: peptidyl-prolyl cis-trans isomerase [Spirochaetes bacterium]|nr:peptidyl-prolyl cis-trans isomerase [Spirochaetota bacterium]
MKRIYLFIFAIACVFASSAQTTIDKPAATIKLTKQEVISVRQIKADVQRLETAAGIKFTADQIKQVLDARVNSLLFVQFCDREKITVQDSDVTKATAQMKASLGTNATDTDLENSMRASGVFVEPKIYVRQRLLFESYVQTKRADEFKAIMVAPTADEVLKAYDLAKASLVRPDTMRVSILYVDTRGKSDTDAKKSKDVLSSISSALKLNSTKFDEYLLRASDTTGYKAIPSFYMEKTGQNKSLFGVDLFDTVFKLKVGDISSLVESPTGYRIVRANEFLAQKQLGLADTVPGNQNMTVQEFLTYQVANDKESKFMDKLEVDLINQLQSEATIKIYDENLKW